MLRENVTDKWILFNVEIEEKHNQWRIVCINIDCFSSRKFDTYLK